MLKDIACNNIGMGYNITFEKYWILAGGMVVLIAREVLHAAW